MKTKHLKSFITATAGLAFIVTTMIACTQTQPPAHTQAQTTESRLGKLDIEKGFPTEETTRKLFDQMDYQRAVQAYLWAYPAVSFESIRVGALRDLGTDLNDFVIADNYADPKGVWLTANDTTIYALANVDLGKSGPIVVEIPPGAIVGSSLGRLDKGAVAAAYSIPFKFTGEIEKVTMDLKPITAATAIKGEKNAEGDRSEAVAVELGPKRRHAIAPIVMEMADKRCEHS